MYSENTTFSPLFTALCNNAFTYFRIMIFWSRQRRWRYLKLINSQEMLLWSQQPTSEWLFAFYFCSNSHFECSAHLCLVLTAECGGWSSCCSCRRVFTHLATTEIKEQKPLSSVERLWAHVVTRCGDYWPNSTLLADNEETSYASQWHLICHLIFLWFFFFFLKEPYVSTSPTISEHNVSWVFCSWTKMYLNNLINVLNKVISYNVFEVAPK